MRDWLRQLRKRAGMTQIDVAKKSGITPSYFAMIELGQRGNPLNVDTAKKIAVALGFDWQLFYAEAALNEDKSA